MDLEQRYDIFGSQSFKGFDNLVRCDYDTPVGTVVQL